MASVTWLGLDTTASQVAAQGHTMSRARPHFQTWDFSGEEASRLIKNLLKPTRTLKKSSYNSLAVLKLKTCRIELYMSPGSRLHFQGARGSNSIQQRKFTFFFSGSNLITEDIYFLYFSTTLKILCKQTGNQP